MTLQNLQADFIELLQADDALVDWVHPLGNLAIYRNNVMSSLINALQHTYPLVCKLVGQDFFSILAKHYIEQYPSNSSNLHDYGAYLSQFLCEYPSVKSLVYLPEVAEFEWCCHSLQFASDHSPLDIKALQTLSPENYDTLRFSLHPANVLMQFYYPILQIIELCREEKELTINLNQGKNFLLIVRRELGVSLITLTKGEYTFLSSLQENKTIAESLHLALKKDPSFQLEEKLSTWVNHRIIVEFQEQ